MPSLFSQSPQHSSRAPSQSFTPSPSTSQPYPTQPSSTTKPTEPTDNGTLGTSGGDDDDDDDDDDDSSGNGSNGMGKKSNAPHNPSTAQSFPSIAPISPNPNGSGTPAPALSPSGSSSSSENPATSLTSTPSPNSAQNQNAQTQNRGGAGSDSSTTASQQHQGVASAGAGVNDDDDDHGHNGHDLEELIIALWVLIALLSLATCSVCCCFMYAERQKRKEDEKDGKDDDELDQTLLEANSILTEDSSILEALGAEFTVGAASKQEQRSLNSNTLELTTSNGSPSSFSSGELSPPRSVRRPNRFRRSKPSTDEKRDNNSTMSPLQDDHLGNFDMIPTQGEEEEKQELDPVFSSTPGPGFSGRRVPKMMVAAPEPIFRTFGSDEEEENDDGANQAPFRSISITKEVDPPAMESSKRDDGRDSFVYAAIDDTGEVDVREVPPEKVLDTLLSMDIPEQSADSLRPRTRSFESYDRYRDTLRASIQDRSQSWDGPPATDDAILDSVNNIDDLPEERGRFT